MRLKTAARRLAAGAMVFAALAGAAELTGCSSTGVDSVDVVPDIPAESLLQGDEAASDLIDGAEPESPESYDISENNILKARKHLGKKPYSESALVVVLCTEENLTVEEAEAAARDCGADWNEQSRRAAMLLLESDFLSRDSLVLRLKGQGFTASQAEYGADNSELDEIAQALSKAKSYLEFSSFSYDGMVAQLVNEGFTEQQAISAANNCGADWYEQAVLTAKKYAEFREFTREQLINQLLDDGFTEDQAKMAVG